MSTLLTNLTSLRDFFSRTFFISAFLPTLYFVFINVAILFVWAWPFYQWIWEKVPQLGGEYQAALAAAIFLILWIHSYGVAALLPLWTRVLEGKHWARWLREPGQAHHAARYQKLSDEIESAIQTYEKITQNRTNWDTAIVTAKETRKTSPEKGTSAKAQDNTNAPRTPGEINKLKQIRKANRLISFKSLDDLVNTYQKEIKTQSQVPFARFDALAADVTDLIGYAYDRALREHNRLLSELYMDFGDRGEIAPTAFGNVGLSAQAYAMRAYSCNVAGIWSSLRRCLEKEDSTKALEGIKSQLDFHVASYWLSLILTFLWSLIFAWDGQLVGAILTIILGSLICWKLWYEAAVEQYRLLQGLIISSLNVARFQVISDLHLGLPADLFEEREMWRAIELAYSHGHDINLRYQHQKS